MEALSKIFNLITDSIPNFCERMIAYLLWFPIKPYHIARLTTRLLAKYQLSTIPLLLTSFLIFAIVLGLPNTQHGLVGFTEGVGNSLREIPKLDTKGTLFYYLLIFVLSSTVLTLCLARLGEWMLRRRLFRHRGFFELFNVFISFNLIWFMLLSLIFAVLYYFITGHSINESGASKAVAEWLKNKRLPDLTLILFQPAILFPIFTMGSISRNLFKNLFIRWLRRNDVVLLLSQGKPKEAFVEAAQESIITIPSLSFVVILLFSSLMLFYLSENLFELLSGPGSYRFAASCATAKKDKLFVSINVENNRAMPEEMVPIYLEVYEKSSNYNKDHAYLIIEPGDVAWYSGEGLFLDAGESRYFRLYVHLLQASKLSSPIICRVLNLKNGELPPDDKHWWSPAADVQGDSYSSKRLSENGKE